MDLVQDLIKLSFTHDGETCFDDHRLAILFTTPNKEVDMPLWCGVVIDGIYFSYVNGKCVERKKCR